MKINEFIVVEGKDDTERVKSAVDCDTIETNGSAIDTYTLEVIKLEILYGNMFLVLNTHM